MAPTLDTLVRLHRRRLERVPSENLAIVLGRPRSMDATASLERVGEVGRAGDCFHQNGALELVLRDLGFDVGRRHWTRTSSATSTAGCGRRTSSTSPPEGVAPP